MINVLNLVGFLLPPAIDLINKKVTNPDAKFWVSVLVCIVVGAIVHFISYGGFGGWDALATNILAIFGSSQITYYGIYQDSSVQTAIRG